VFGIPQLFEYLVKRLFFRVRGFDYAQPPRLHSLSCWLSAVEVKSKWTQLSDY